MGGVTLTVFELVTAMFAAENYNLREDWDIRSERIHEQEVLKGMISTAFLTAVTLLSSYQRNQNDAAKPVTCKRKDVLKLTLEDYKKNAAIIEEGLKKTARFLAREKIFDSRTLPYSTQLIALSVICALLKNNFEIDTIRRKLSQWFWCGVFGELYGGANETRFAMDIPAAKTNRVIGGKAPSVYLTNIEKQSKRDSSRLYEILKTHKITPELLRSNEFENFIRDRASKILNLIEAAMNKRISGRDWDQVIQEYGDSLN